MHGLFSDRAIRNDVPVISMLGADKELDVDKAIDILIMQAVYLIQGQSKQSDINQTFNFILKCLTTIEEIHQARQRQEKHTIAESERAIHKPTPIYPTN